MTHSRKTFIKHLGVTALALPLLSFQKATLDPKLKIGLASYTLRKYNLTQLIEICKRLDIKDVAFKSFHLPLESSDSEIKAIASKVKEVGLNLYGGGVIYMKNEEEVKNAFRYAQAAEMKLIIGVPNHELLPLVEKYVKETNIKLAIHNHGPGDNVYPTPATVYEKIEKLDNRIGLCIDIGHVVRLGMNPIEALKKYGHRMFDMHLKDVDGMFAKSESIQIGRGVINIPAVLKTLKEVNYQGVMSIEYEKDENNAESGLAESVGYLRGILAMMERY
ncbi:Inosose dehydratase [Emticicia aquatica]|uniref:Inosose dehydratase n=1 Tax=Emticicia aquatica TaxID=1681835 RepID=A0ABN8EV74_9BACT|nr:sugar phosphate isomerase/epimerase [Emticicia aquatica]CAH0995643.1 Inosose dehydratase [Emticicia aquatica]